MFVAPIGKKLSLVYLVNEVVQQSRARKREEFTGAFASVVPDALADTYKQVPKDVKERIKRVIDVWKQRMVFPPETLEVIDNKVLTAPAASSSSSQMAGGSSLLNNISGFGGGGMSVIPSSLKQLTSVQKALDENETKVQNLRDPITKEYSDLFDTEALPAPPAYAKKLASLLTNLEMATASTKKVIATRKDVLSHLKTLIETNEAALKNEDSFLSELDEKLKHTKETKTEVEGMLVGSEADVEAESTTPPAPEPSPPTPPAPEPEPLSPVQQEQYSPVDNTEAPAYSPLSSDDEDASKPQAKKQKTEEKAENGNGVEGLDPAVAQFLSTISGGSASK